MNIINEKCAYFDKLATNTTHFVTTKLSGYSQGSHSHCNMGFWNGEKTDITQHNRNLLCDHLHIHTNDLFVPREVHGRKAVLIDESFLNKDVSGKKHALLDADALITTVPGIAVAVSTADCVPIICTDNKTFVAAIHAGWRGIVSGIIEATLQYIRTKHDNDLLFMVGPCICGENYEVGEDVWQLFKETFTANECGMILLGQNKEKYFPDLRTAATLQIQKSAKNKTICQFSADTYTDDRFYSVRKSGPNTGRFLTGLMLNKK